MRELLVSLSESSESLPSFTRVPHVAKLVACLTTRTATDGLLRDINALAKDALQVLQNPRLPTSVRPLL
eukprot:5877002-Amphidinium_carterae.1